MEPGPQEMEEEGGKVGLGLKLLQGLRQLRDHRLQRGLQAEEQTVEAWRAGGMVRLGLKLLQGLRKLRDHRLQRKLQAEEQKGREVVQEQTVEAWRAGGKKKEEQTEGQQDKREELPVQEFHEESH